MKKFVSIICIALAVCTCFCSCAKAPEEPVTTATSSYTLVNNYPEAATDDKGNTVESQEAVSGDVNFVLQNYYTYGNNYAKISNISFNTEDYTADAMCYFDLEMIYIGKKSDGMVIGYKAYDAEGNLVRDTYITQDLKGIGSGDIIEDAVFEIPYDTAKVVFYDYAK